MPIRTADRLGAVPLLGWDWQVHAVPVRAIRTRWGRLTFAVGIVSLSVAGVACSESSERVARCDEPVGFVELSVIGDLLSPTGRGFISKCDFEIKGDKPIEVYSSESRDEVIGWLYDDQCGFPEGLAQVGESALRVCGAAITVASSTGDS
jgi:hypothetical protein